MAEDPVKTVMKSGNSNLREAVYKFCLENIEDETKKKWFENRLNNLENPSSFYLAFGMVNKKFENESFILPKELENQLQRINPAFKANSWTFVEFCRLALLLQNSVKENITTLLASADMKEQVVIYKSFQFLDNPEDFLLTVIDGIRTNMIDVFDAIALENAYPLQYFSEDAWNHMVLKAIFMERPIYRIYGIDKRRNAKLAGILQDFAHERWAAGRVVTPELWRMMSGFLTDSIVDDLKKVISTDTELAKIAAIKVLNENNFKSWLESRQLKTPQLSWDEIGLQIRQVSPN